MSFYLSGRNVPLTYKFLLITILLSISLPVYPVFPAPGKEALKTSHHLLVIDAGSSGSRIYIYRVQPDIYDDLPKITLLGDAKVEPGISNYEEYEKAKKNPLCNLIYAAKKLITDPDERKITRLYILATAGMRMLDKGKRNTILEKVTDYLKKNSSFQVQPAMVLSGQYEGLYSWLAVNYLDDQFKPCEPREGMLEMGGASTQIAFQTSPVSGKQPHVLKRTLRNEDYTIFSRSYLYMGADQVRERLSDTPACFPLNFPMADEKKGNGNFDKCAEAILKRFNDLCRTDENKIRSEESEVNYCIFNKLFQPQSKGDYFAISSFYYTFDSVGAGGRLDLDVLRLAGQKLCAMDWDALQQCYKGDKYVKSYCLNAAYFWSLLKNGYHIEECANSVTSREIMGNTEVSWTLGAALDIELGNKPAAYTDN
jgi:hypothetical protein